MNTMKVVLLAATCVAAPLSYGASFTDDFADASNVSSFGNASDSVSGNILSLTRTDSLGDAGADWLMGGTTRFSLTPSEQQDTLEITANAQIGDGQWSAFVLFFDGSGAYLSENQLFGFSTDTGLTVANINDFATNESVAGAAEYQVRLRIQGTASSGFEFSQLAAVPEPSSFALIGGLFVAAGVAMSRRSRR